MSDQQSFSQMQAHMEHCSSMFVFQCCFGVGVSAVLSNLEQLFSSIPPTIIILHSTDLGVISVDGCLEWGFMAGLRVFASHGGCILSGGWLDTVEAPGHPRHLQLKMDMHDRFICANLQTSGTTKKVDRQLLS